jgi:hypothetical protein
MLLDGLQLWQRPLDRYELLKTMILGRSEALLGVASVNIFGLFFAFLRLFAYSATPSNGRL